MLSAAIGSGEQRVLAGERKRADRSFDDVVDLDATVVEEEAEPTPANERVADRLGELALLINERKLPTQPGLEHGNERTGTSLAGDLPLLGPAAAELSLDSV